MLARHHSGVRPVGNASVGDNEHRLARTVAHIEEVTIDRRRTRFGDQPGLFANLAHERVSRGLVGPYAATGKFPFVSMVASEQDLLVSDDDAFDRDRKSV